LSKRPTVTGITGQDGAYLTALLLTKAYEVFGAYRRLSTPSFWRLQSLGVFDKITFIPVDLTDTTSIMEAIKVTTSDEIYSLSGLARREERTLVGHRAGPLEDQNGNKKSNPRNPSQT
jgi:GDPmannose 4,6-dehydratase